MMSNGSEWSRREFVSAVGAAVATTAACGNAAALRGPTTVKLTFEGVFLAVPDTTAGSVDIRMPLAEGANVIAWHPDTTPADPHFAYLALFDKYAANEHPFETFHLLGKNLIIDLGASIDAKFDHLASFKDFTTNPKGASTFDSGALACQISLKGGSLRPNVDDGLMGKWSFSNTLLDPSPKDQSLAHSMTWDSGKSAVDVMDAVTKRVVMHLEAIDDQHPSIIVGHQRETPDRWTGRHPDIKKDVVDHDFKWLYRIVTPDTGVWEDKLMTNGYPERLLPAPRCHAAPIRYVGSPTCFGGCFGC
jgi:hypothetical protein